MNNQRGACLTAAKYYARVECKVIASSGEVNGLFRLRKWIGVVLMLIASIVAAVVWVHRYYTHGDYFLIALVFGGLALLLIVGNLVARCKPDST